MTNDRARKRAIRAKMADTGLSYTQAMRLVDEEWEQERARREAETPDQPETAPAE